MSGTAPNDALEKQHHQSRRGFQQRRVQTNRVQTNSNRPGSAQLEEKQRSLWDNFLCLDIKRKEPMQRTTWAERSLNDRVCDCDFDFQWSGARGAQFTRIEEELVEQRIAAPTDDLHDQHFKMQQEKMRRGRAVKIAEEAVENARKNVSRTVATMSENATARSRISAEGGMDPDTFTEQRVIDGKKQYMFNTKEEVINMWKAKEDLEKAKQSHKQATEHLETAQVKLEEIEREIKKRSGGVFDSSRSAESVKIDPETPAGPNPNPPLKNMEDSASASQKGSDTSSVLSPRLYSNPTAGFGRGVSLTTPDMEPGPHLSSPRFGEPGLLRKVPVAAPGQWMDGAQFMQLNSPRSNPVRRGSLTAPSTTGILRGQWTDTPENGAVPTNLSPSAVGTAAVPQGPLGPLRGPQREWVF